jgi:predicted O-methyltransferase YrrM
VPTIEEVARHLDDLTTSMVYSAWRIEKRKLIEFLFCSGEYAIEIGSFAGSTSRALGIACKMLKKRLVCIDPWEGEKEQKQYERYLDAISDIQDTVITIRADSSAAVRMLPADLPGNTCLLFIDGDHNYPKPLHDMSNYWPMLSSGGVMAVHDIFDVRWHAGIFRAVTEFFQDKPGYCLEAMNYIPTQAEAKDAEHLSSGLIWVSRRSCQ